MSLRTSAFHKRLSAALAIRPIAARCKSVKVSVPSMGESITDGTIQSWNKRKGDFVAADEVVAVIETDKVSVDVNAPVDGVIVTVKAAEGESVNVGDELFTIDTEAKSDNKNDSNVPETAGGSQPIAKVVNCEDSYGRITRRVPMSRMRQRIGSRLKEAQSEGVCLTTFQECDMSRIMDLRKKLNPSMEQKYKQKLGFMSFFMAASRKALEKYPALNNVVDGKDVLERDFVDISIAVSTPTGLMVPVIRDVQNKGLVMLEAELAQKAKQARDGKLLMEDMQGGTFTISNGGIYGSYFGTPVINPPQSGILGMHSIVDRAVVRNGAVVVRPVMILALTYDHRIVDGREAVQFLKDIASSIENPESLLDVEV